MKNLNGTRYTYAIFVAFAICFIGTALFTGTDVTTLSGAISLGYKAIGPFAIVAGFFITVAWKWPIFRGWLVPIPYLGGTWHGWIKSTWQDPLTGSEPSPMPAILTIRQSFVRISCVMRTREMTSGSYTADFWLDVDNQVRRLAYNYHSDPLATLHDRSVPHNGTMLLDIVGSPPTKLKGPYWTGRKTTGEVELTFRTKKYLDDFPANLATDLAPPSPSSNGP